MNQKRNKQRRKNQEIIQKNVIRCNILNRPVFEHEVCSQFSSKVNSSDQKNCKNCKYSF